MTTDRPGPGARSFAFGPFLLLPERQLLLHDQSPVRIGGRALDILTTLVERPGQVVTKSELIARVWPNVFVDEGNLKVHIAAVRRTLGDGGRDDVRYIATVVGEGYRFVAPVATSLAPQSVSAQHPAPASHRHNLRTGTTRIVGRAEAIAAIRRDIDLSRLVSIVGAGGVGKTTVAFAVAEQALTQFTDGVWLVDLALLTDRALVPSAIATTIGLPVQSTDMLAAVCDSLRDRQMLLVLDNCEHVIDTAAVCASRILADAAGVKLLVTSREPLKVKGERVRRLTGLSTPERSPELTAEHALEFPAIQLFVERATDRLESFRLSDADAPAVAEICRRLDGLALSIELAAARIDAFNARGLLTQLDNRFRILVGRRAGPERHRTLMATLDWSYGWLPPDEAVVLRAVSVFAGAFGLDGAGAVSGLAAREVADALAQLAAKSLLAVDIDAVGVAYRLLETTRVYCLERLHDNGEERAVRRRHAEHVCTTLERASSEWAQRPSREWESAYRDVGDDLRSALAWAGGTTGDAALLVRLTVAGGLYWNHFSLNEECRIHTTRALEELYATGLTGTTAEMQLQESLAGAIICTRGLLPQATTAAQRALDLALQIGSTDFRLRCLRIIGVNQLFGGALDAGIQTLSTFTALAAVEDSAAAAAGEVHIGMGELHVGRLNSARRRLEDLDLALPTDLDGAPFAKFLWDIEAVRRMALSNIQWLMGRPETAARTVLAAVERARHTRHELSLSNALAFTCQVFFWSGLHEQCRRHVAALDELMMRQGIIAWRPLTRFYRGALACALDGRSSGLDEVREGLAEFRAMNHLVKFPYYAGVLADELAKCGRWEEAEEAITIALAAADRQNEQWCIPELLRVHASIVNAGGQTNEAEALLQTSLRVAEEIGALSWQLRTANDLAKLWRDASRADDARKLLRPIYSQFDEGFHTRDLVVAANLLNDRETP